VVAIADGTLFGLESIDDLLSERIAEGDDYKRLRFHDHALERPILRKCTKAGGVTDELMSQETFLDI
jgi:hypothetical protein